MTAENTPDPSAPDTIMLVHGLWVTPRSWEHWIEHYENNGYRVLAPAYPGLEVEVEVNRHKGIKGQPPMRFDSLSHEGLLQRHERAALSTK